DRAVRQSREVREEGLRAAEGARREGRASPPRQAGREADDPLTRAGRVHRREGRGPVQAGALSLLRKLRIVELSVENWCPWGALGDIRARPFLRIDLDWDPVRG